MTFLLDFPSSHPGAVNKVQVAGAGGGALVSGRSPGWFFSGFSHAVGNGLGQRIPGVFCDGSMGQCCSDQVSLSICSNFLL